MMNTSGRQHRSPRGTLYLSFITSLLALLHVNSQQTEYLNWEDAPASRDEFDHDNDPSVCGIPVLTVEEWEAGRYWEGSKPVLVKNVTDGWAALKHWKKCVFFIYLSGDSPEVRIL